MEEDFDWLVRTFDPKARYIPVLLNRIANAVLDKDYASQARIQRSVQMEVAGAIVFMLRERYKHDYEHLVEKMC